MKGGMRGGKWKGGTREGSKRRDEVTQVRGGKKGGK